MTMARTKLFVSYSRADRKWLEHLKLHLSPLERLGTVHLWSDTRIGVGDNWRDQIEKSLGESRAAVLLISPAFLASEFIWVEEMPCILAHQAEGMEIFPLIVRPCAWRIEPKLAVLQARPEDGLALSLGGEAEIDRDLADFVYEIAARLNHMPSVIASDETDRLRADRERTRNASVGSVGSDRSGDERQPASIVGELPVLLPGIWTGAYDSTDRRLMLTVSELRGSGFEGQMAYDDGGLTAVEGRILTADEARRDRWTAKLDNQGREIALNVAFREVRLLKQGASPIDLGGEYRGVVSGALMHGIWIARQAVMGRFNLRREARLATTA